LLYAKDIPRYRRLISEFYQSVRRLPAVSDKDMSLIMSEYSTVQLNNYCWSLSLLIPSRLSRICLIPV